MAELRLAGNLIQPFGLGTGLGHLQIVRVDDESQFEIEVQAPTLFTLQNWRYPQIPRSHNDQQTHRALQT